MECTTCSTEVIATVYVLAVLELWLGFNGDMITLLAVLGTSVHVILICTTVRARSCICCPAECTCSRPYTRHVRVFLLLTRVLVTCQVVIKHACVCVLASKMEISTLCEMEIGAQRGH